MDVSLDPHWESFVAKLVKDGRYGSSTAVVAEGLRLLEEREAKLGALRTTLDAAVSRGGSHSDAEVAAAVASRLADLPTKDAAE